MPLLMEGIQLTKIYMCVPILGWVQTGLASNIYRESGVPMQQKPFESKMASLIGRISQGTGFARFGGGDEASSLEDPPGIP